MVATLGNNAHNYLSKVAFKKQVFAFKNLNTFLKGLALLTESKATTKKLLAKVNLATKAQSSPNELFGGQALKKLAKDDPLSNLSQQSFGADITKAPK